ncbi:restriction endonuclease subunit S [Paludibacter jiangxiensis]|uniref:Type I restriction enzyme, S subunit n=1 Tax=Paludibacter jiangxiensis TaxID=681398 RepID=A0A161LF93_9BACT|nr:restriction endonuclease subunit S [Paludibacter jiangxiensis]GAT63645.1 type I restriction enzyme, S subunit [Paludibacter jiangxiensis]
MNNILLDSLPIWITAQAQKTSNRGISASNLQLLGIQKLRELILELAVRGKLVPQDPNDEPASELLKRIKAEYKHLSKEGKIKKSKALPNISEDEFPYDLPKGWEYVRLNDLGEWGAGATPNRGNSEYYGGNIPWFKSGELVGDYISESEEFVTELALTKSSLRYNKAGDVLIAMYGATIGKTSILKIPATTNQAVCACTPFSDIYNVFLLTLLKAYKNRFISMGAGGAQPNISREKIIATVIALPPLAEQHRIVAKVDELMALCDELEKEQTNSNSAHETLVEVLLSTLTDAKNSDGFKSAWQRIARCFDTLFITEHSIDKLKQTILQLAVMGKLVPQNPNDKPASELLKKIAAEKARLVKEGKIKKQAALPEFTEEEKPFELPTGWEWVRLSQIGELARGKSKHRPRNDNSLYQNGIYPMIQTGDVAKADKFIGTYTALYNEKGLNQSRLWPKGTMCITIAANIADTSILGFDACFPDSIVGLIVSNEIGDARYFDYFIRTAKNRLTDYAPSTAQKNINLGILESVQIPLPPLNELNQIVFKVDELFALCDSLKDGIKKAQEIQNLLAEEIVKKVVK